MKKTNTLFAMLALFGTAMSAQTSLKMAFQTEDGVTHTIDAKSLSMSIAGDKLIASNGGEKLEFELPKLTQMYFTSETAGIKLIPFSMSEGNISAYTLDGKYVGNFSSTEQALANLSPGVYIVKNSDNKCIKIAVQ